jgi:hypothetical protein
MERFWRSVRRGVNCYPVDRTPDAPPLDRLALETAYAPEPSG